MCALRTRFPAALVALALVGSAFAQPAARSFNSYYFFGDSLTDNGNTFALTGSPPPPYFNGRVSNGITYAEYLRSGLAAAATAAPTVRTNLNFAFAGATAGTGSAVPTLTQQIGLFQARGITPTADDLFVVLAGANDVLNTISNPATQNAPAVISSGVAASTAVANTVQTLAGLGARNILVLNLPDISRTARFVTGSGAPAATLAQAGSAAFNNDIEARIAALNLPAGTNVTVFDLGAVFQGVLSNAQLFGFTNITQEYLGLLAAGGNPGDVNGFIFWDGIHPTTRMHAILAQALTEALNPEFVLGNASVQGTAVLTLADMVQDAVAGRLDLVRHGGARENAHGFVSYSYKDGSRDFSGYQNEFTYDANVFTAGFDVKLSDTLLAGVALSAEKLEATLKPGAGTFELEGQTVSAYAQWKSGMFFADAVASWGQHDLRDIVRTTALGGLRTSGETSGDRWGGALRVGGDFAYDNFHVTPFLGLRYTKAKLDGYTESGVGGLNFAYEGQTAKSVDGLLGVNADLRFNAGEMPLVLGLTAMLQKDIADDVRDFSGRLADTVAARATIGAQDGLEESIKLGVRFGGAFSKRWGWSVGYLAEIRDDGDTASQYSLSVQTGF